MSELVQKQDMTSIVMSNEDNVATLLKDVEEGEHVFYFFEETKENVITKQNIPFGHKVAIKPIAKGENVMKYGEVIGAATYEIIPGQHVHVHNIEGIRGRGDKAERREEQ